jgi:hypothetical protein
MSTIRDHQNSKLAPRFYVSFHVLKRIGFITYRLQLPPKSHIHNVFHVVFLKNFNGAAPNTIQKPSGKANSAYPETMI